MPFTGAGSNIYEASDVFFSGLASQHVLQYNSGTSRWNNVSADGFFVDRVAMADRGGLEKVVTTSGAGTYTVNLSSGNVFYRTLTGNSSFVFSGATNLKACSFTLYIAQGGTPRTVTWTTPVRWAGGVVPTITATANKVDIFVFETVDGGTNWFGSLVGNSF